MDWVGASQTDQRRMMDVIGVQSADDLLRDIPNQIDGLLDIGPGMSETRLLRHLASLASRNEPVAPGRCFLGAGAYEHAIPSAIDALVSRGEFLTAYTPYQPEASQGTLTATFEFQSMICQITGMDVANASMYDGASAMAEAALLALRQTRRRRIAVSGAVHPQWREVLQTYVSGLGDEIVEISQSDGVTSLELCQTAIDSETACLIVQQPNFFGHLEDLRDLAEIAHASGALLVVACNPVSLGLLASPGEVGADIAVGDCQPLGVALNYGGPYAGFFSVRENLVRQMPGRLAGMAWDSSGQRGFTLTLQTREQHIRRERATSNICTNQALLALTATVYLALAGRSGFQEIAQQNLIRAHYCADKLQNIPGVTLAFDAPFFNEFTLKLPCLALEAVNRMRERGWWAGLDLGQFDAGLRDCLLVAITETKTRDDIDSYCQDIAEVLK